MDMGVIAAFKLRYRRLLLSRITANIEERDKLREAAKDLKAGMKGLDAEHDPQILDVADLVYEAWEEISEKTIARCSLKADILPRAIHGALQGVYGKVKKGEKVDENYDVEMGMLINGLEHLKLCMSSSSDLAERIHDVLYEDVEEWVCVESNELVQEALVEEVFDSIANDSMMREENDNVDMNREVLSGKEMEQCKK